MCVHNFASLGTKLALAAATLTGVALPTSWVTASPGVVSDGRSAYAGVVPCRLADTRDASSAHRVVNASTIRIQVTGRCGVRAGTSAVAVSITVTDTTSNGYAVVTPATISGPTSTINWASGETRAASTVVAVSPGGALDVRVSAGLDAASVVVDVTGSWALVSGPVSGGRLVSFPAHRVLDTRAALGQVEAGTSIIVDRATLGIPDSAVAVVGTLTTSSAAGAGFLTAYPAGTPLPITSNVNNDRAGQDRAAGIIVALGSQGLAVHAGVASADIIFDVTGYVTGASASESTEGLLIAVSPRRVLDTRTGSQALTMSTSTDTGEPFPGAPLAGVIATITAADALEPGHATIGHGDDRPATSALNWPGGAIAVAAMTIQPVTAPNDLIVTTSTATSIIVDVTGYLLAADATNGPELLLPGMTALTTGTIADSTGVGRINGDPIVLLAEVYSANVLAAGGGVSIVSSDIPGGGAATVPYDPSSFPACGAQPRCIVLSAEYWDSAVRGGRDANRVMIAHEWAHVLSMRYQAWVDDVTLAAWRPRRDAVHEECLADAVASVALARAGQPGNETPTYIVHYMCDTYWASVHGPDAVAGMQAEAALLANDLLAWAEGWGAIHRD